MVKDSPDVGFTVLPPAVAGLLVVLELVGPVEGAAELPPGEVGFPVRGVAGVLTGAVVGPPVFVGPSVDAVTVVLAFVPDVEDTPAVVCPTVAGTAVELALVVAFVPGEAIVVGAELVGAAVDGTNIISKAD